MNTEKPTSEAQIESDISRLLDEMHDGFGQAVSKLMEVNHLVGDNLALQVTAGLAFRDAIDMIEKNASLVLDSRSLKEAGVDRLKGEPGRVTVEGKPLQGGNPIALVTLPRRAIREDGSIDLGRVRLTFRRG